MADDEVDVAVVGAGPAGAATALAVLAARPDADVVLVDAARTWPRDKVCGDAVAPQALAELRALGVPGPTAGGRLVDRLRTRAPSGRETAVPSPAGDLVERRETFDARLRVAALVRGARPLHHRVRRLSFRGEGAGRRVVLDGTLAARVVVGADGASSTVRRAVAGAPPRQHVAVAMRAYAPLPDADRPPEMLVATARDGWPAYAWSFPLSHEPGRANVGYGALVERVGEHGRAHLVERLAAELPDSPADPATLRAALLPLSLGRARQPSGRVLLVGDAAGLVNPLTGEGIYYAVHTGRLAGTAAAATLVDPRRDPGSRLRDDVRRSLAAHLRSTDLLGRATRHLPLLEAGFAAAAEDLRTADALHDVGLGRGVLPPRALPGVLRRYPAARRALRGR